MSEQLSIRDIKKNANIVEVIDRYYPLKKQGTEFVCPCPFHGGDKTASFKVNPRKQLFKCFGCGAGGDVFDFMVKYMNRSWEQAINEIKDPYNTEGRPLTPEIKQSFNPKPIKEWKQVLPPTPFVPPVISHYNLGVPSKIWAYRNESGIIIGYVCRFDTKKGKQVLPFTFCTNGELYEWRWHGIENPRPLYNLDKIVKQANSTQKKVVISEGEKTADAVALLVGEDYVSSTWIGGSNNVHNTDWSPIFGFDEVILWPDHDYTKKYGDKHPRAGQTMDWWDQPGNHAMLEVAKVLTENEKCKNIRWVLNPKDTPCGWDAADATWGIEEGYAYMLSHLANVPEVPKKEEIVPTLTVVQNNTKNSGDKSPTDHVFKEIGDQFFRFLGYHKEGGSNVYNFYSYDSKSVISLAPTQMGKANLMQLAPLEFWEEKFPANRGLFSVDQAQNHLISRSVYYGVFNESRIRGRGAWIDKKDVVVHTGGKLIVNGKETPLDNYKSRYIYEIGEEMGFDMEKPLNTKMANRLLEISKLINWEREIDAYLLAGWCVIAPACGAFSWRPHIWLTGAAGTGKSWIFKKIVRFCLGESALSVQGETSEAGLRQMLCHDAMPVVFDEAEGNDRKAQDRMQSVLSLMRSSSTADSGIMAKGTSSGAAQTYSTRSCFAFASISVQISQQSDRTRVTVLSIKKVKGDDTGEKWKKLQSKYLQTMTKEYVAQLRSRTIAMLPVILKNAATFSAAAAAVLGEQRAGDQIGALLAGAYSLTNNGPISYNEAVKWIKLKDWNEERTQDRTRDEIALFNHIMEQMQRVESTSGVQERTIGELVMLATEMEYDFKGILSKDIAHERLKRIGIKVSSDNKYVVISNSHKQITKLLEDTSWKQNYNKTLLRLEGAISSDSERFASGVKSRAVKIPLLDLMIPSDAKQVVETDTKETLPF